MRFADNDLLEKVLGGFERAKLGFHLFRIVDIQCGLNIVPLITVVDDKINFTLLFCMFSFGISFGYFHNTDIDRISATQ